MLRTAGARIMLSSGEGGTKEIRLTTVEVGDQKTPRNRLNK
jgi:hypothetical protein